MDKNSIYQDIAVRTDGAFLLGVVGPVRTGKSTFIKRFMESIVIPQIENTYMRERTRDELPQSGSGKTIMTAEPKFVPENAISIKINSNTELSVRLIDCVGYMVDGAGGQFEDGTERLVTTPWFDHEIPLTEAAEKGTYKVIAEHSTIGIVVTTDGSICEIPRENYIPAEERVISELKSINKPFVVLLNCLEPKSERSIDLAKELSEKYSVECLPVNCQTMGEKEILDVLSAALNEFPLKSIGIYFPEWLDSLDDSCGIKQELFENIKAISNNIDKIRDSSYFVDQLSSMENISNAKVFKQDMGAGEVSVELQVPRTLYYSTISEQTGIEVNNDGDLISRLIEMSLIKKDYDKLKSALDDVRSKGYGVVIPDSSQMKLEEPQIVRQGGKYSVKLKANAPAIHMLMTNVETEVSPALGGETASEDIINFLLQGFDGDVNRIWESNIFGKSLYDIAEEGLTSKIDSFPEAAKEKLKHTLQRIINEGSGGLICILL